MKLSVFVCLVLIGVLLAEGTSSGDCGYVNKPQAKQREIRNFVSQPKYLSTAVGFGKREVATKQDRYEKIVRLLQEYPQSIFASWVLQELSKNPELAKQVARTIVSRAIDSAAVAASNAEQEENPGELSTSELFKSERTISFF